MPDTRIYSRQQTSTAASECQSTNLRNVDSPAMHAQGVRDPAVAFLLAHAAPAGIMEGAARMVVVGTHGESRAVRLGARKRESAYLLIPTISRNSCIKLQRTYDGCKRSGIRERFVWDTVVGRKSYVLLPLGPFRHLLWNPPSRTLIRCANCSSAHLFPVLVESDLGSGRHSRR